MKLSRRNFLGASAASAASVPLLFNLEAARAQSGSDIDWKMGFPEGAVLLNRNENPIGPSAKAVAAATEGIPKSFRYADPIIIRTMLAGHHGVDEDHVLVGTGSGEILNLAPIAFCRHAGDNIVATWESYRPIPNYAAKLGATVKWVNLRPENNYAYDVDALLDAVDENTRILFMVTPNNPTGTLLSYSDMKKLADGVTDKVLLIIDEAYIDFQDDGKNGIDLVKEGYRNILVTRTFSKAFAMAGLRCGYGIGHPDVMREIDKFGCDPTSVNMAAFGAVVASLQDRSHVENSRKFVRDARDFYQRNFDDMAISCMAGPTIFILPEFGEKTAAICAELKKRKIFIRDGAEWGLPNHARISYGLDDENEVFFRELKDILANG